MMLTRKTILFFAGLLAYVGLLGANAAGSAGDNASSKNRTQGEQIDFVIKRVKMVGEPVELIDVQVAGQSLIAKEKVTISKSIAEWKEISESGKGDWLDHLQAKFRNVSGRPIVAMDVKLVISHPSMKMPYLSTLVPARQIPTKFDKGIDFEGREVFLPDAELVYSANAPRIHSALKELGATGPIKQVEISIGMIQFTETDGWHKGTMMKRDTIDPNRWNPVTEGAMRKTRPLFIKVSSRNFGCNPRGPVYSPPCLNNPSCTAREEYVDDGRGIYYEGPGGTSGCNELFGTIILGVDPECII